MEGKYRTDPARLPKNNGPFADDVGKRVCVNNGEISHNPSCLPSNSGGWLPQIRRVMLFLVLEYDIFVFNTLELTQLKQNALLYSNH